MSTYDMTQFKKILTDNGHHVTKARQATFALLLSPEPLAVRDILEKANGTVDRVSIYRNIELFEKLGIVHRIYVGWKYKLELSDQFVSHHHHLSCLTCGKVIDIEDEKHIDAFIHQVAAQFGFTPRRHQFEIDGYCNRCSQ
ncbi:MAG TPA: Fur family transcriptional regulator [Candidatus Saccharimonadales bacterium]|nr:Fur family transcriptional regulator [Candidatus Saccharimonadales bacterium]